MNNERLIVKHKSESGIVNFIYDYQNEVVFLDLIQMMKLS